jgi:hypothetical protein
VRKGAKGEMISLSQENDKTLFFDFVPLSLGKIRGYDIRLHLYTVPGDVGYQQSRQLISKGVDGMVFMADSRLEIMNDNLGALRGLKEILTGDGLGWGNIPVVLQYNKRDLPNAIPVKELDVYLNSEGFETFETIATEGRGVYEVFSAISKTVLKTL